MLGPDLLFAVAVAIGFLALPPSYSRGAAVDQLASEVSKATVEQKGLTASGFEIQAGAVVDPDRGAIYLMNPHGGVDAIAISSGALLWTTTRAAKPLLLVDKRLIAQAEPHSESKLTIVVLDVERAGNPLLQIEVPLPSGVTALIDQGLGTSFTLDACANNGMVVIRWRFRQMQVSGIARPVQNVLELQGAALVDLNNGHVESLKNRGAAAKQNFLPPNLGRLLASAALIAPPRRVGNQLVAIERVGEGTTASIIVKRWSSDGRQQLSDIRLPGESQVNFSADGNFALASKADGADERGLTIYLWKIYSLGTGEQISQMKHPASVPPFFVYGSVLAYESSPVQFRAGDKWIEEPLELRAIILYTGIQVWKRAVRDTSYRGSAPPNR